MLSFLLFLLLLFHHIDSAVALLLANDPNEIAQAVWPEAQGDVYDANIDRMVSRVRSRIEPDSSDEPRFIATIRGYGYQLLIVW